ncbi:MAG: porin [Myxococcota bacterium]
MLTRFALKEPCQALTNRMFTRLLLPPLLAAMALPSLAKSEEAPAEDPLKVLQGDLKKLQGLKVTGYVQARYEQNEASKEGVSSDGTPANTDQFYIRRGRIKVQYSGVRWSEVMLQLDATGRGLSLKDAEITFKAPLEGFKLDLTAGQTKLPFGYEIIQSSSARELPERAKVITSLFPGERDRGIKLKAEWRFLNAQLGVFNGNGTEDTATKLSYRVPEDSNGDGSLDATELEAAEVKSGATLNFGNTDRDAFKDVAGRLGVDFALSKKGKLTAGLSGYFGQWGVPDQAYIDLEGNLVDTNLITILPKNRLGADFQVKYALLEKLGATELRGEFITGSGLFEKDKQKDVPVQGYSATFVQGLGKQLAFAARVDSFDADTSSEQTETTSIEPALLFMPNDALKLTLAYQLVQDFDGKDESGNKIDKANNRFLLQFQGKF